MIYKSVVNLNFFNTVTRIDPATRIFNHIDKLLGKLLAAIVETACAIDIQHIYQCMYICWCVPRHTSIHGIHVGK